MKTIQMEKTISRRKRNTVPAIENHLSIGDTMEENYLLKFRPGTQQLADRAALAKKLEEKFKKKFGGKVQVKVEPDLAETAAMLEHIKQIRQQFGIQSLTDFAPLALKKARYQIGKGGHILGKLKTGKPLPAAGGKIKADTAVIMAGTLDLTNTTIDILPEIHTLTIIADKLICGKNARITWSCPKGKPANRPDDASLDGQSLHGIVTIRELFMAATANPVNAGPWVWTAVLAVPRLM